jgi:EmrB/QacA subfamily drug resistance transporter
LYRSWKSARSAGTRPTQPLCSVPGVDREKRLVLIAAIMGTAVVSVDSTVVNVALPAIRDDLGGGLAGQQWISNGYLLTLSSLILVAGSLGDLFGERRVFALGVAGFGVASVLCAVAPTIELLVGARALQGVFGALLTPAGLAVIAAAFPPAERGHAVGLWTAWGGIGIVAGPLIGGQLVDSASWRWIFAINIPLVLATLWIVARAVPESRPRAGVKLDSVGAGLCAVGLAGITFGLIEQPLYGWGSIAVAGPLVGGALLFAAFVAHEMRTPQPMLPLGLFKRRNFSVTNAETFAMYAGLSMLFFFLVVFLQQTAGYSALDAGLATMPVTLVMFALSGRVGALADRQGPRLYLALGPLIAAGGLLLMQRVDASADYVSQLLPALLVFALGLSVTVAPLTATVLADADESNAGIASAVNNAIARVAGLIAIAAIGAVVAAQVTRELQPPTGSSARVKAALAQARDAPLAPVSARGLSANEARAVDARVSDASVSGFHLGVGIGAALVALGGLLGAAGLRNATCSGGRAEGCAGGQITGVPEVVAEKLAA